MTFTQILETLYSPRLQLSIWQSVRKSSQCSNSFETE